MSTATEATEHVGKFDLSKPKGARAAKNTATTVFVYACGLLALIPLVWILFAVISQGLPVILNANWWIDDLTGITFRRAGGGALHAIIGTLEIGLICAVIAVPLGILGAIFLIEYARGTRWARVVSFMVDILSGVPSIVAALFVFALFITILGQGRSGFAAAVALVLLMLPVVLRSTEEMLKLVPDSLREASYALGVPKWKTILNIVIPTAFSGIATGIVLGLARVMGETAPLLILVGYAQGTNTNPNSSVMGTLPTMINDGRTQAESMPGYARVWGAALTLIILVMGLNLLARALANVGKVKNK
ncbi:phosphate ABC transporter permease PstA [Mariniluteicoccus flavus]